MFSPVFYDLFQLIRKIHLGEISGKRLKKYLFRTLSFLVLSFLLILGLNHTNVLNYESPIPYSEIDRVSFENFRGLEFFRKRFKGNYRYAYIVTSIEHDIKKNKVIIETFFHPSRSYVFKRDAFNKELLNHELYHFKITELYARKMRRDIKELSSYDEKHIYSIIDKYKKAERRYQKQYDLDTYHSYVRKQQVRYENEIDSLISSLKDFANTRIIK